MTFDIFDAINEATKEADAFEEHPAKVLGLEDRLLYLQGLALVMNADGDIHPEETEYLRILIKSFDMDGSSLEAFVSFAQKPDKATIKAFFRTFRRKPIALLFLFDALMMTRRDGSVSEKEVAVVNIMADQLEVLKGTQRDIHDLFCHIKNRNWQEGSLYFDPHLLNSNHFKHLLAYHEVDHDELMKEIADIRRDRLIALLKTRLQVDEWVWEPLSYSRSVLAANSTDIEITSNFVNPMLLSHDELVPFLQAKLDRGELRVKNGIIYKSGKSVEYGNLVDLALDFDQESLSFLVKPRNEKVDNLLLPAGILFDYFTLIMGFNLHKPKGINQVLELLFSCQIAYGEMSSGEYGWGISKILFPISKGVGDYLKGEIVLSDDGSFWINDDGVEVGHSRKSGAKLTVSEVLVSGRFRLVRKVQERVG